MKKYYLIRRKLESFQGPYTLADLRIAYKNMEFGLHDEIAGHAGPWISLHDVDAIREQYDELADFVVQDLMGGWGQNTMAFEKDIRSNKASKKDRHSSIKSSRRQRQKNLQLSVLAGIVVILVLVVGISNSWFGLLDDFHFSLNNDSYSVSSTVAEQYWKNRDETNLMKLMDQHASDLSVRVQKSKKLYDEWIPFLRWYAYQKDGELVGSKSKYLRGTMPSSAPSDCSLAYFRQKTGFDAIVDFVQMRAFPKIDATRVVLWDAGWIRRRKDVLGWRHPGSYYEACLMMYSRAAKLEMSNPSIGDGPRFVDARLSVLTDGVGSALDLGSFFRGIYCLDKASSLNSSDSCLTASEYKSMPQEFQSYFDERKRFAYMRIALENGSKDLDSDLKAALEKAWPPGLIDAIDSQTRFDYGPELRALRLMIGGYKANDALTKAQEENPNVQLRDLMR